MTVTSILFEALRGKKPRLSARGVSLGAMLTAGLYEVSQALSAPGGELQHSLDLIVSAATSILRVERCVLLLEAPGQEQLVLRSLAGIPRPRQFDKYRQEIHETIFGQVMARREGTIIAEGRPGVDRRVLRLMRRLDVKGFVIAPILRSDKAIGILVAATPMDGRDFSDADLKLLSVMANFASVAIENSSLVAHLDRKARKLSAIVEIGGALNAETDPSVLFQLVVDRAKELMGATSGSMILVDRESGVLRIEAERGLGPEVKGRIKLRIGEGVTGWVAQSGEAILVTDVRNEPRYIEANPAVRSEIAVPIMCGGQVVGVINLDHTEPGAFTSEDVELMGAFANAAAVALRHARIFGESRTGDADGPGPC